jgi:hypothetical protein
MVVCIEREQERESFGFNLVGVMANAHYNLFFRRVGDFLSQHRVVIGSRFQSFDFWISVHIKYYLIV